MFKFLFCFILFLRNSHMNVMFTLFLLHLQLLLCLPHLPIKFMTSLICFYTYTHNLLNKFSVAHRYMCLWLTTWNCITH